MTDEINTCQTQTYPDETGCGASIGFDVEQYIMTNETDVAQTQTKLDELDKNPDDVTRPLFYENEYNEQTDMNQTQLEEDTLVNSNQTTDENANNISDVTYNYMATLVKPYSDVIAPVANKDILYQWCTQVFQNENLEKVNLLINNAANVDAAKDAIISFMMGYLLSTITNKMRVIITPWDVASIRDNITTEWFGAEKMTLPIKVTIGPNTYIHELSEELAFGLLSILSDKQYTFSVFDVRLMLEDISPNYIVNDKNIRNYKANIPMGEVTFNTPDVIQGVVTAAQWLSIDEYTLIKDLTITINGETTILNF